VASGLVLAPVADARLVGWWTLDDGAGAIAADASGNGHNGIVEGNPQWVTGIFGGALQMDGDADDVRIPPMNLDTSSGATLTAWIKPGSSQSDWCGVIFARGGGEAGIWITNANELRYSWGSAQAWNFNPGFTAPADEWSFVALVVTPTAGTMYLNSASNTFQAAHPAYAFGADTFLGYDPQNANKYYEGTLDDCRIYDHALTPAEIQEVWQPKVTAEATKPVPANNATDVPSDVILGWTPGPYAATHTVYFGISFDDVNTASTTNPLGVLASPGQSANTYDPPRRLAFDQTYYWRVDEVNAPPDGTVYKGSVWSFTVEPFAYQVADVVPTVSCPSDTDKQPQNMVNGSGLTDGRHEVTETDMWLGTPAEGEAVWLQFDFDRVYKLHETHIWNYNMAYEKALGFGLKTVNVETTTDGETWTLLGDYVLEQGTGKATYAGQTLDLGGVAAQSVRIHVASNYGGDSYGLSEIRFYYIPAHPREPQPAAGATGVGLTPTLSWRAGREAVSHEVSFGTDQQAVADGTAVVDSVGVASYGVGPLDLGKTYYWKVDEVNQAEAISTWSGDVWNFTTQQYTVIDNIESYTEDEGNEVFSAWVDGYQINDNGSVVGYEEKPYVEKATVRSGAAAMPISYDNSGTASVSTAKRTFAGAQDWTQGGASILRLFFRGNANNNPSEPMWVRLTDQSGKSGTVTYGTGVAEGTDNQTIAVWHEWSIPLAQFGVNLTKVASMTIGFGGSGPRSSGLMLFDDIRLYPDAPASTPVLAAYWALNGNAQDGSGNGNDGALMGGATWAATGKFGGALSLNGTDAYVDCGNGPSLNITEAITLSAWVNTADANNAQHNPFVGKGDQAYAIKHNASNQIESFIYDGAWYTATYSINASFNGAWHHVASTYDGLHLRLYVDGVLRRTVSHTGSIATTTYNVNLGRNSQNTDRLYNGLIDEVRIYDGVLPPAEIVDLAKP
jgi:hypothetical protein